MLYPTGYVKELASKYSLPLRVGYNKARGFFIQIPEQGLNLPIHRRKQSTGSEQGLNSSMASCSQRSGNGQDIVGSQFTEFSNDGRPGSSQSSRGLPNVFIKVENIRGLINCTTTELVGQLSFRNNRRSHFGQTKLFQNSLNLFTSKLR